MPAHFLLKNASFFQETSHAVSASSTSIKFSASSSSLISNINAKALDASLLLIICVFLCAIVSMRPRHVHSSMFDSIYSIEYDPTPHFASTCVIHANASHNFKKS